MSIHLYIDAQLSQQISEGDLTNPDSDTFDGSNGDNKDRQLFVANEQTTLAEVLDAVQSAMVLAVPRFSDGEVIMIDSEEMRVVSGGGTTTLMVQRALYGTQPAAHAQDAIVYSACNYSSLLLEPVDTSGTDESSWCKLALTQAGLDAAVPGGGIFLSDKSFNETISFWRRISVPAGISAQKKTDIKLRLTGTMSLA
ncbi:MAG: hypothetical protein ABFD83_14545 [Armatimonadota bacterium]